MNLFNMNNDNTIMNIDGKDIEMKPAICYGKVIDKWLVSKCGKVWSTGRGQNKLLFGKKCYNYNKKTKRLNSIQLKLKTPIGFWEDGSGGHHESYGNWVGREIAFHKVIIDTWAPLYDNPPEPVLWETWENIRDYEDNFKFYSQSVVIDHIDDDPTNNSLDNLRRVTSWDNQCTRKAKGI